MALGAVIPLLQGLTMRAQQLQQSDAELLEADIAACVRIIKRLLLSARDCQERLSVFEVEWLLNGCVPKAETVVAAACGAVPTGRGVGKGVSCRGACSELK